MIVSIEKKKRSGKNVAFEEKGFGGRLALLGEIFASRLRWGTQCCPTNYSILSRMTFQGTF
jgi:hypothetical protein